MQSRYTRLTDQQWQFMKRHLHIKVKGHYNL